ncbi:MAG: ROK family protein [Colwellia sp.]|nr:ROK family protein [Colwellia sp.]
MIIAIDVGGTKISAALTNNGEIIEQRKIPSVIHSDLTNLSQYLIDLCQDWLEQTTHVAIACTGQVGDEYVNFLSAKQKLPLKAQLETAFNLPVTIINDASAAAWAEYSIDYRADDCADYLANYDSRKTLAKDGTPYSNTTPETNAGSTTSTDNTLVYITVSTGIGGGIIQNGQLVTSADGFCAHLGHVSVQHRSQQSIQCHCGRINCAEAIASGTAIAKQASVILNKNVSCKEVFEQYLAVTEIAQLIEDASSAVCDLIASVKAITGTERVILGGSVGSCPTFHQQVIIKVANLPKIYQVSIALPQMGANADLIGAHLYANKN